MVIIQMIVGMLIGLSTLMLGQEYYRNRFKTSMPDVKVYGIAQVTLPMVMAGLFCRYGYHLLISLQLVILMSLLLLAAKIDKHNMIIPNGIIVVLLATKTVLWLMFYLIDLKHFAEDISQGLCGLVVMAVTFLVLRLAYKGGIGMGDIKLMVVVGLYLGVMRSMYVLLVASMAAVVISLMSLAKGKLKVKDSLSFGPSIALGGVIVLILGI
ncbi:MAG: prepilin peptidase [Lachnospiraceae bacterium]|nr:prepilin peptidase [Lachnospiraceae bacterium]